MRFFDVIFATHHLDDKDTPSLWREQEAGNPDYVARAVELHKQYIQRLTGESGHGLQPLFGFNITTSIAAMLPSLPTSFVTTTCEFPAVLSTFRNAGADLVAWACPFSKTVTALAEPSPHMVLLISHVDYITGQDIVNDVIDTLSESPLTSSVRFSVIIDGAHGIGNVSHVADVTKIRAAFEERLRIEDFVYVFDHNKWLHGHPGLAVSLHSGVRAPGIEGIFPGQRGDAFGTFDEPVSVSFNPLLPQWVANYAGPADNAFDRAALQANEGLAHHFRSMTQGRTFDGLDVLHANSNVALLTTDRPRSLFQYLSDRGYRTHLMGASRIRGAWPGGTGGVRLTFSSRSLVQEDVDGLVDALAEYPT